MSLKSVREIIYGKLQDYSVQTDIVDIIEEPDLRQGPVAVFHVRTMHAGYYHSLGFWKINTLAGELQGVAIKRDAKFEPANSLRGIFVKASEEERALRQTQYGPIARMITRYAAENIKSVDQLFSPVNYVRQVVNSTIQRVFKEKEGLIPSRSANEMMSEKLAELCNDVSEGMMNQARPLATRLAYYSAASRGGEEISEGDVQAAVSFLQAIFTVTFEQFGVAKKLVDLDTLSDSAVVQAFMQWRPFSRLSSKEKTPLNLIRLLLETARVKYVIDNLPTTLDENLRSLMRDLLG